MDKLQRLQTLRNLSGDIYASYGNDNHTLARMDRPRIHQLRHEIMDIIVRDDTDACFEEAMCRLRAHKGPYMPSIGAPNQYAQGGAEKARVARIKAWRDTNTSAVER